jgi:hypothetical protein
MDLMESIAISNWEPVEDCGALRGFFSAAVPTPFGALVIHHVAYFDAQGQKRRISLPKQVRRMADGAVFKPPVIDFATRGERNVFERDCLRALDASGILRDLEP